MESEIHFAGVLVKKLLGLIRWVRSKQKGIKSHVIDYARALDQKVLYWEFGRAIFHPES